MFFFLSPLPPSDGMFGVGCSTACRQSCCSRVTSSPPPLPPSLWVPEAAAAGATYIFLPLRRSVIPILFFSSLHISSFRPRITTLSSPHLALGHARRQRLTVCSVKCWQAQPYSQFIYSTDQQQHYAQITHNVASYLYSGHTVSYY